ncbi:MAG: hypothetical protein AAGB13_01470 [Cyanobacteria bacterium P01_F01_bin.33]
MSAELDYCLRKGIDISVFTGGNSTASFDNFISPSPRPKGNHRKPVSQGLQQSQPKRLEGRREGSEIELSPKRRHIFHEAYKSQRMLKSEFDDPPLVARAKRPVACNNEADIWREFMNGSSNFEKFLYALSVRQAASHSKGKVYPILPNQLSFGCRNAIINNARIKRRVGRTPGISYPAADCD